MSDQTTQTNPTPQATEAPRMTRVYRLQSVRTAQDLTRALEIITAVQTEGELRARLLARGVEETFLNQGTPLQATAQQAFETRQTAMSQARDASTAYTSAVEDVRGAFNAFRQTARTLFTGEPARIALELEGKYPYDLENLISTARTIYTAALTDAAYTSAFARLGYGASVLQAHLAALDTVIRLRAARDSAHTTAVQATRDRDAALGELDVWLRRVRLAVRLAARDRPELTRLVL